MSELNQLYDRMIAAMGVEGLRIPLTAVRFYFHGQEVPSLLREYETRDVSYTSCQASRQAGLGDALLLTRANIGCIAAGITFGLIDQTSDEAMDGARVYTDIMRDQSSAGTGFRPPTPRDFTEGRVYACREQNLPDFCLFGTEDSGRFVDAETARRAIAGMSALQPAKTEAVFFFGVDFDETAIEPDVVTLDVRPVELTRICQGWQFLTGERVTASMGPVRVVNSDLIVRPFLERKINFSSYCVGARLIGAYAADRLGIGMPMEVFRTVVEGMEASRGGYPFPLYPGAADFI